MTRTLEELDAALGDDDETDEEIASGAADRLRSYVNRITGIEQEMRELRDDRSDVYAEAKAAGFEPKILRTIVRLTQIEASTREEMDYLTDLYRQALGI